MASDLGKVALTAVRRITLVVLTDTMKNTKNNDEARQKQIKEVYGSERAYQQHQQYARRADDIEKERGIHDSDERYFCVLRIPKVA